MNLNQKINLYEILFKTFLARGSNSDLDMFITFEPSYFNQVYHEPIYYDPAFKDKIIVTEETKDGRVRKSIFSYVAENTTIKLLSQNQPIMFVITRNDDFLKNYKLNVVNQNNMNIEFDLILKANTF